MGGWTFSTGWVDGFGGGQIRKDGRFTLWRLYPGVHQISLVWNNQSGTPMGAAPVDVTVGDSNVDGVVLRVMAAADLEGRVEYENEDARSQADPQLTPGADKPTPQVWLQGRDATFENLDARVGADGAFTLAKVKPGRYQVTWSGAEGYIKSVHLGSTEIAGAVLDLSGGAAGANLTVVVSTQFGSIAGIVHADAGAASRWNVMLAPDDDSAATGPDFAEVGPNGSYPFDHLAPGKYKLAALSESDTARIMQGDDELESYASIAEKATVRAGEKTAQDLKARD